jgi:hypothetical protein
MLTGKWDKVPPDLRKAAGKQQHVETMVKEPKVHVANVFLCRRIA